MRHQESNALHIESRGATASRAAQRLRHGFVVAQIALAFVLLSGAGLLALSLGNVMALSPGFAAERTLSGHISLPGSSYPDGNVDSVVHRPPGPDARRHARRSRRRHRDQRAAQRQRHQERGAGEGLLVPARRVPARPLLVRRRRRLLQRDGASARGRPLPDRRRRPRARRASASSTRTSRGATGRDGRALGQRIFQGGEERPDAEAFTVVGVVGRRQTGGHDRRRRAGRRLLSARPSAR